MKNYHELCNMSEDARDVAAFDYAKGMDEEAFPMKLFDAIQKGVSAVATFREYRGISALELAKEAGISPAYLSQIETGKRTGSAKTLKKIADVLDIDVDLLL